MDRQEDAVRNPIGGLPLRRYLLAILFAVLPWPAAWWGLYVERSAPLAFVAYHGVCIVGGLVLRSPGLPAPVRVYSVRSRDLLVGVVVANLFILLLYVLVGDALLDRPHVLGLLATRGLPPRTYLWLFPYFALVNPTAEEFFWRGGVYATLRHLYGSWIPVAAFDAVLFGSWHWLVVSQFVAWPVALAATGAIAAIGFGLAAVYEHTRRLPYAIILHAFAGDAPLLVLLYLLGRG